MSRIIALSLILAAACGEHQCGSSNLLTMSSPAAVASFEVRDKSKTVLWKITSEQPRKLSEIRYGEVPAGYLQSAPAPGVRPRPFVENEELSTFTVAQDHTLFHRGVATGPKEFCGGYYESTERPQHR
jgi:hypothetical protein